MSARILTAIWPTVHSNWILLKLCLCPYLIAESPGGLYSINSDLIRHKFQYNAEGQEGSIFSIMTAYVTRPSKIPINPIILFNGRIPVIRLLVIN
jgi:hypothetical protein